MNNFVTLLATPAAIVALVNLAKALGAGTRVATLLAVVLGVVLSTADHLLGGSGVYQAVASGLLLGLAAAGLYDLAGRASSEVITTRDDS